MRINGILTKLKPLRQTRRQIEPADTVVVTFSKTLPEAVELFKIYSGKKAPTFLIADETDSAKCEILGQQNGARAFPLSMRSDIPQKNYCLYAAPKWNIWDSDGLETLATLCAKEGITSNYTIAEATLAPLPKRKPSPEHIERRMRDIEIIYNALADDTSKEVFLRFIKSLQTGDANYLPISSYAQYRHPRVIPSPGDVVIDGGAFDGASALAFSALVGATGRVIAFEPLASSSGITKNINEEQTNIKVEPYALWSKADELRISEAGSGSTLSANGAGTSIRAISLDEYFASQPSKCDYVKLDVEGAEPEALLGANETIKAHKPKLCVCLYHKQAHYLDIPLFFIRNWPFYDLYMGHHSHSPWESCLYATPRHKR